MKTKAHGPKMQSVEYDSQRSAYASLSEERADASGQSIVIGSMPKESVMRV
jgi:hypothetical protein